MPRWAPVALIVLCHLLLGAWSAAHHSAVVDEPVFITGGYTLWRTGSAAIDPSNPPLAKLLISFPLLLQRINVPWNTREFLGGYSYAFAERLFFWSGNDAHLMLFSARAVNLLLSCVLAAALWLASLRMGRLPALVCLAFYCFSPAVLANASLATNDFPAAFFTTLAFLAYLGFHRRPGPDRAMLVFSAALAAVLCKFTAVLVWPCLGLLAVLNPPPAAGRRKAIQTLAAWGLIPWLAAVGLTSLLYPEMREGFLLRVWQVSSGGHPSFLAGQVSAKGWWWYYLAAFLAKSTLPEIAAVVLGMRLCWKRRGAWVRGPGAGGPSVPIEVLMPLVALAVFGGVASMGHKQVGLRYILPVYPMLALLAAAVVRRGFPPGMRAGSSRPFLGEPSWAKHRARLAGLSLAGLQAVSTVAAAPRFLPYFNPLCGGSANGWRLLVDSNLDWGQDLLEFARLHREEGRPEVVLSYFGGHAVEYLGIKAQHLRTHNNIQLRWKNSLKPAKEWLVVSATNLQGVYIPPRTFAWLKGRRPALRAGPSLFIYDITADAEAHERLAEAYAEAGDRVLASWERERARALRP